MGYDPRTVQALADPLAAARALRPLLEAHAEEAEGLRRIPEPVLRALRESGLMDVLVPRRAGGPAHKLITHLEVIAELGKGCVGSAWSYGLLSSIRATAKAMPAAITEHLFRRGDELFCAVSSLTGDAIPTADGYRITGRWAYGSGCMHADWLLAGVRILDEAGAVRDTGFAILPLKDDKVRVDDVWRMSGMQASGSNTVVADGVEIPRALMLADALMPDLRQMLGRPGLEPRDLWPLEPRFALGVLASMLGAAAGMLEHVEAKAPTKSVVAWSYATQADSQVFVEQIGTAAMEIDSAWLHIRRATAEVDETSQHRVLNGYEKARIQADCGYAMAQLRRAGERLMDVAGPSAFTQANPMQRLWRDLSLGSRHTALQTRLSLELYGRARLGLPSNIDLLPDITAA